MNILIELRLFTIWQRQKKKTNSGKIISFSVLFNTSRRKKILMSQFHRPCSVSRLFFSAGIRMSVYPRIYSIDRSFPLSKLKTDNIQMINIVTHLIEFVSRSYRQNIIKSISWKCMRNERETHGDLVMKTKKECFSYTIKRWW